MSISKSELAVLITKSELVIMRALDAAPDKCLDFTDCRKASGLTVRGVRTVIHRLLDCRWLARSEMPDTFGQLTLTFKGLQVLKEIDQ